MQDFVYHKPVLFQTCLEGLNIHPDGTYVDLTFGGGGHSRGILSLLGPKGRLVSFDQDVDAQQNLPDDKRLIFVHANFKYLRHFLDYHNIETVNGILADLGVSSHHFDEASRGFSFRADGPLDMRMNQTAGITAAQVVATYSEADLVRLFKLYGELSDAKRLAATLIAARSEGSIKTTTALNLAIGKLVPEAARSKYLAKVYQALRIEVNGEMAVLEAALKAAGEVLAPKGRLVIMSYHSLEDRLVKNFMRTGNCEGTVEKDFYGNLLTPFEQITRKVVIPSDDEIKENPRSRSAKLRIAEKK